MTADELFAKLQRELPRLTYGGREWFLLQGDERVDNSALYAWCEAVVGPKATNPPGEGLTVQTSNDKKRIVRWAPGVVLTWCCLKPTFGNDVAGIERYGRVRDNFARAALEWEGVCGVQFRHVPEADDDGETDRTQCIFGVRQKQLPGNYIALAFFPNDPPTTRDLLIDEKYFSTTFDPVGVMRHEIGHILGFRHEHIAKEAPAGCRKLETDPHHRPVTPYDSKSVMHYPCLGNTYGDPTFAITAADRQGAVGVYGLPLSSFALQR